MPGIRLFEPNSGKEEENAVIETIRSGFWASGAGTGKVAEFERDLAEYTGFNNVIAVNSGTAALHLALSLLDIKGKEVILPALSFVSTANAILYNGGIPVFADVEEDTLCLDPLQVYRLSKEKTGCIIQVNFGGMECDEIWPELPVVADSAHRIERNNHNEMTCYSFHPVKNLAMPTGGAIAWNGDLSKLKARRWCGITDRTEVDYDVKEIGWNYYMNEISATIGIEQLKKLDSFNRRKYDIAKRYNEELKHTCMPLRKDCSYHLFWLLVDDRKEFRRKMSENGIETGIHYKPIDRLTLYKKANIPVTDSIADRIVSIPIHSKLTDQEVDRVIKVANS